MNLTRLPALVAILVLIATLIAFSSTARAQVLTPVLPTPDQLATSFLQGELSAIMDAESVNLLPPDVFTFTFRQMAEIAENLSTIFRVMQVWTAMAYFDGRGIIFNGFADLNGEPR